VLSSRHNGSVAFSSDGERLAVGGGAFSQRGFVRIWEANLLSLQPEREGSLPK
jgi:hypothetical protein